MSAVSPAQPATDSKADEAAVTVQDLVVRFGEVEAVRGVSFGVGAGEVFGLLGPNGAGKTTTIRVLTTLLRPTEGSASVAGYDVVRDGLAVREAIGYVPQAISIDGALTARENLEFYGRVTGVPRKGSERSGSSRRSRRWISAPSSSGSLARCRAGCSAGSRSRRPC